MSVTNQGSFVKRVCPLCGESSCRTVLELGSTPLGDRFETTAAEATALPFYPLDVVRCSSCGHAYVPWLTNSDESYRHYLFHSENSPGLSAAFREIAEDMLARHSVGESDFVVDIGANDGSWLQNFQASGAKLLAVEPAPVPAAAAEKRGLPVLRDYFSKKALDESGQMRKVPRLVTMNYVFANLPSPLNTLREIAELSDESTVISVMTGYHPSQLQVNMYDYVYHEHLSYFSCSDIERLCYELGLVVSYARELPLKGGSLHIEMRRKTASTEWSPVFQMLLSREKWLDQPLDSQWEATGRALLESRKLIKKEIASARAKDQTIIGYGASHSTTTLVYSLGLSESIDLVFDDNTLKHGLFSPGSGIPVVSSHSTADLEHPLILVLAWQHSVQILGSIDGLGIPCRVVVPFPSFRLEVFD